MTVEGAECGIEQLATIVQKNSDCSDSSCLVAIQPNGSKLPFFCVPGVVENTGVWSNQSESERSDLAKWAEAALPVQHIGQPEEVAQAVLSLITNSYLTGVILPVDGGLTLL